MRCSGSLARQARTSRSSAGAAPVATASALDAEIAGGSALMIAPISDAWLRPSNARRPVAIS